MRLGGKVYDRVDAFHGAMDDIRIANASVDEGVSVGIKTADVFRIAGVRERIHIHDYVARMIRKPVSNEIRPDKSRSAGDQQFHGE